MSKQIKVNKINNKQLASLLLLGYTVVITGDKKNENINGNYSSNSSNSVHANSNSSVGNATANQECSSIISSTLTKETV
jgi:hypothetical protein